VITHSTLRGGEDDPADSLREQAWQGVMHAIQRGGYRSGDRLPPERELAETLGVSRSTLRLALHDLDRSGVIVRRAGRGGGTFVGSPKVDRDLGHFAGLAEYIRRQGLTAGARVISVALLAADSVVADALGADVDAPVVEIIRVRLADGEPIALERSYFSADRFPGLAEQPLGGSLYELLREAYQDWPTRAVERLQPIAAEPADALLLGVSPGTPLLAVERITHGREGVPIEYAYDLFRGDRTRVVVWTGPGESIEEAGHG
jgi:GntR family transcriptional regulator